MIKNSAFTLHELQIFFVSLGFVIPTCVYTGGRKRVFFSRKMIDFFAAFVSENFPAQGNDLVCGFSAFRACCTGVHTRTKIATMGNIFSIFFFTHKPGFMYGKHS